MDTWVLLTKMTKNMEGVHVGFLWKVTGKMASRQWDGTWIRAVTGIFLKEAGTQTLETYIDMQQTTVVEWVALGPIYEVFNRQKGYKGGIGAVNRGGGK